MNFLVSLLFTALFTNPVPQEISDFPIPTDGTTVRTVYFFCDSRLIDVSKEENQHVVITDVYEMEVSDNQVSKMVQDWTNFVNEDFANDCRRTSDFNLYHSKEEAANQLEKHVIAYFSNKNTTIEKVDYQFDL